MKIDYSKQLGKKLITKGHQKICVHIKNIMYIQCHGGLATLFLHDESKVEDIKSLKAFEEDLCEMGFIRISRNTIVNVKYITKIDTNRDKKIVYLKEIMLEASRRRLAFLRKCL
ncbi:MAG: LytTR family transcriptional regulator DNA-binding domain-containing protein [Bacteroidetes bacterium]|nr:LytTR family transcriptional regulator DNA-binding domain-containing protein [Bacteroidota bacterium]MCL2303602.1 LytTR family transcriptional regulator DNA-binding domain-containing protein [Lentimicrobiaceae bacterium]